MPSVRDGRIRAWCSRPYLLNVRGLPLEFDRIAEPEAAAEAPQTGFGQSAAKKHEPAIPILPFRLGENGEKQVLAFERWVQTGDTGQTPAAGRVRPGQADTMPDSEWIAHDPGIGQVFADLVLKLKAAVLGDKEGAPRRLVSFRQRLREPVVRPNQWGDELGDDNVGNLHFPAAIHPFGAIGGGAQGNADQRRLPACEPPADCPLALGVPGNSAQFAPSPPPN